MVEDQAKESIRFFIGSPRLIASKQASFELSSKLKADESYFAENEKIKKETEVRVERLPIWATQAGWQGPHDDKLHC